MPHGGDPRSSLIIAASVGGAILLLAVVLATQVLFYNVQSVKDAEGQHAPRPSELVDLQISQRARLETYRWIDQPAGVAAIPIDRAIELYVRDVNSGATPTTIPTSATQPTTTSTAGTPQ